jgi:hypothetical protein
MSHSFAQDRCETTQYRSLSKLQFSAKELSRIDAPTQSRSVS